MMVVFSDVYNALNSFHNDGWVQLDVRPANIIVTVDNSGNITKVTPTDWGHSSEKEKKFIGSLPFIHDEFFCLIALLAYSIASLSLDSIERDG